MTTTKTTSDSYRHGFEAGREAYWAGRPDNSSPLDGSDWARGYRAGHEAAAQEVRKTLNVK